jgi:hypothetical protein
MVNPVANGGLNFEPHVYFSGFPTYVIPSGKFDHFNYLDRILQEMVHVDFNRALNMYVNNDGTIGDQAVSK